MLGVQRSSMVMRRLISGRSITRGTKKIDKTSSFGRRDRVGNRSGGVGILRNRNVCSWRWGLHHHHHRRLRMVIRHLVQEGTRNRSSSSGDGSAFGAGLKVVGFGALVALGPFLFPDTESDRMNFLLFMVQPCLVVDPKS